MIIGVCGTFASGKDTVAEYLESRGFYHVSTGDLVRQYVREHDLGGLDRDNLRKVANEIRAEFGYGHLVEQALVSGRRPIVISGIRNPGEVEAIHMAAGIMIAVDAPVHQRFAWAKGRGRVDDGITAEKFREQEVAEEQTNPNAQQITAVISMSDYDIANDGTLEELASKIDAITSRLKTETS